MKTTLKSRPCGNPQREFARAHAHERKWVLGGQRRSPLALTPGLGWGRIEVPPGGHLGIPWGIQK